MIEIPPKFENDTKGRDTNLIPLVKIGSHFLSTNDISFDGDKYLPLLDKENYKAVACDNKVVLYSEDSETQLTIATCQTGE